MTNNAIIIESHGGPEVLKLMEIPVPQIKDDEVLVRHTHCGLNFIDTYYRSGLYPTPPFPVILGAEAAGIIENIGKDIKEFKVGDRVCYTGGLGAYCTYRAMKTDNLIKLPQSISNEIAASCLLKGLTAQYLLRQTANIDENKSVFFHAAAGGVGLIFGQWAQYLGAKTIGTAGSDEKCSLALKNGFNEIINYKTDDFVKKAILLNDNKKFDVVYDSVGKDTFLKSLDLVKPLGLMVSFGQSSGAIAPFDIGLLAQKGSIYLTRPTLFSYISNREKLLNSANELFSLIEKGIIKIEIGQKFSLNDIAKAHINLEARRTIGTSLIEI